MNMRTKDNRIPDVAKNQLINVAETTDGLHFEIEDASDVAQLQDVFEEIGQSLEGGSSGPRLVH